MPTETEYTVDIQQLVKNDMAKFLADNRGRPAYDNAVFRKPESLPAATRLIKEYLDAGKTEITVLAKMVDYAGDVYDQAMGFAVMEIEYPPGKFEDDDELYRSVHQGVISFLKTYKPTNWEENNWRAFKRLFVATRPRRLEPSNFRILIWNILYGEETDEAGLPKNMPHGRKESYIRQQLEKM